MRFFLALCASIAACDSSTDFREPEPGTRVPEASVDAREPEVVAPPEDAGSTFDAPPPEDASLPDPGAPPSGLLVYRAGLTGVDARPRTTSGVLLAGGGPDNDAAMTAAITNAGGGDAVVLRMDDTGGAYAPYLVSLGAASATEVVFDASGGNDAVDGPKLAALRALADSTYLERLVGRAELVFFAGGNQTKYVDVFRATRLAVAVDALVQRGGVIGGTSAGMHVLSGVVHTPRGSGNSITSSLALRDPYIAIGEVSGTASLEFSPGPFHVPGLEAFVLDTHFSQRGRLGRETVFVAREIRDGLATVAAARGLACDEGTAVLSDASGARVFGAGTGGLTLVVPVAAPDRCEDNRTLDWRTELDLVRVPGSDAQPSAFDLRTGTGALATKTKLSVKDGVISER
jgi:cyanophycinase-like exopeptidase